VGNVLADPDLKLHSGDGTLIADNDNWQDSDAANIQNTGIAPLDPAESALIALLAPGNYTAIVRGEAGEMGVGLFEAYNLR
jgi:hypothetical protein